MKRPSASKMIFVPVRSNPEPVVAKCGDPRSHGAHVWQRTWCAGNQNVVVGVTK